MKAMSINYSELNPGFVVVGREFCYPKPACTIGQTAYILVYIGSFRSIINRLLKR